MLRSPPDELAAAHPHARLEWLEPFGLAVWGLDMSTTREMGAVPPVLAHWLEAVMAVHGFVVFRGLGPRLSADDQLRISSMFGTGVVFSTHKVHPAAEHPEVMRLSNDESHGFVQGGAAGGGRRPSPTTAWGDPANGHSWHHDGLHEARPFGHVSYHVPVVPRGAGSTAFAHLGSEYRQRDDYQPWPPDTVHLCSRRYPRGVDGLTDTGCA
jgi:alpha-ketoglutarate-dependent taurine dioxygenase